ncbi:M10 family metallopeptidase [Novosphingobium pituita]|uniref:M10 family metallopeptidase C-terminal domain-containing protein n=1 Tax=Novosphingobium pituita TaxID=3056842 RepID=A0ABQ6P7T3_9SPHN|nr:M10 family metallopeptidase [Novosphingobium sp. IK01]GMM60191.1 M10 family metallopeptidase C-terminal domain-containing protein [Novosphingobium sp. IK01]
MASYTDVSPVSTYALTKNKYVDSLLFANAAMRNAWSTLADGKTQVSFSFAWANGADSKFAGNYGAEPLAFTHGAVPTAAMPQIADAFQAWANVANLAFTQIDETGAGTVGDIRIGLSSAVSGRYWGYARLAGYGASNVHGDIWISPTYGSSSYAPGTYNYMAILHEIGHALGLDHPFEGNRMPSGYDVRNYTIMSYTDPKGVWWFNSATGQAEYLIKSPMVYDIAAIQSIYGANTAYHAEDTTYTYSPNAPFIAAIWDGGGNDTIDLQAFSKACVVSLLAGTYSTLGFDTTSGLANNLGIAFNCTIENVTGGAGADKLTGNEGANVLTGGAGDDTLTGNAGADSLWGGEGKDILKGGNDADILVGGAGKDTMTGGTGADHFVFAAISEFGGTTLATCDVITDFNHKQADLIDLSAIDANTANGAGDDAFAFIGTAAFHHVAGELRYASSGSTTIVQGDINGDGVADFWLALTGRMALVQADFVL